VDFHIAAGRGPREAIFQDINMTTFYKHLQKLTTDMGIGAFTWHWLRRGFATDLLRSKTPLAEIVTAGGWRSNAFMRYLLQEDIDEFATADRVFAESDSD